MMLIILDKNPELAAMLVPDKIKFKQLIELGQLVCSAGISDVFKKIPQGKELQEWVKRNDYWVLSYFNKLYSWSLYNINMKGETICKLEKIIKDLMLYSNNFSNKIETAIFRYSKDYKCIFPSNAEITIGNAIEEYKKYLRWKGYDNIQSN